MPKIPTAQRITIHQFHYSASPADAVTNHMLAIQRWLAEIGIAGEIFSTERKPEVCSTIRRFKKEAMWNCDLMLLHHSHGNPSLPEILRIEVPKAIVYHNITPREFFRHDPLIYRLCDLGRQQLETLAKSVKFTFAESHYNGQELATFGFPPYQLFPLFDLGPKKPHEKQTRKKNQLLFVGRVSPHKNQALLIKTLFFLRERNHNYSLFLVGGHDPIYSHYLKLLIKKLGLEDAVHLTGKISQSALDELYVTSDAFVSASLHEGYCIPVVEAMGANLPLFALSNTAVTETMGGAGLELLTQNPVAIAETIDCVLGESEFREAVLASQSRRYDEIRKVQNKQRAQALCTELITHLRKNPKLTGGGKSSIEIIS